nr:MAG TPA: hypothetical protein [Caudoviricetes sp.]
MHQLCLTIPERTDLLLGVGQNGSPAGRTENEQRGVTGQRGKAGHGQRILGVSAGIFCVGQPVVHGLALGKVGLGDADLTHTDVLMVELQLPVGSIGELLVRGGLLLDAVSVKRDAVGMQDEGAVVVQNIGAACLGCIVLSGVRSDDLGISGQHGALTQQEAVVVGAVIGATVILDDHKTVDGGQADLLLEHIGDGVLVVVQQAHLLVLGHDLGVDHQQAELAGHIAQCCLLHVDQLVGGNAAALDRQNMIFQTGNAQNGVDQLDQQTLLIHTPVAASVACHSCHGIGRGQLTGQLERFPSLHAVNADPRLLTSCDLGGDVVGHAVTHQRSIGVRIQRVIETNGTHHAAVVQRSGQALVGCQNAGGEDGIGESGFLIHKALIDLGVKREAAKSTGNGHRIVTSLVSCSPDLRRELLEKCRVAGTQRHALCAAHLEKLLQGRLCTAALTTGLRDDDGVALRFVARLRVCAAILRGGGALLEKIRLVGFEGGEGVLNILSLILTVAQCSSVRQQRDSILFVQCARFVSSCAEHAGEGKLRSLLRQLVGQVTDLTAQVVHVYALKGCQTLLRSGQLRLQALYSGLMGGFVLTMQAHDLVDLLLGQTFDGSQILTFHCVTSRWAYSIVDALPCAWPCTSLTPGAWCDLCVIVPQPLGKNVMSCRAYKAYENPINPSREGYKAIPIRVYSYFLLFKVFIRDFVCSVC